MGYGTCNVTLNGQQLEYPYDTQYEQIIQEQYGGNAKEVLLVRVNGKLQELYKRLTKDCELVPVTASETTGHQTYSRTASFILLKAIYDTCGKKDIDKVVIHYSLGNALYFTMPGKKDLTDEFLAKVKTRMQEITARNILIKKRNIGTEDAISLFHRHHMYDKEKLFYFRRSSRVNVYSIENFDDYFYGAMAYSTGYVSLFDLQLYEDGFVLILPRKETPDRLDPFVPKNKIFQVMKESHEWGDKLDVSDVGDLNERITKEGVQDLVLIQEALHEAKISRIAEKIEQTGNIRFVMIAGPSSSGKTSFSHRLSVQLSAKGLRPHPIAVDNYFVNRDDTPLDEFGEKNYECLEAIDTEQFNRDMLRLLDGDRVEMPVYNFVSGQREYKGDFIKMGKNDILVIEGIHGLNNALSYALPDKSKFKIYISALTQLNIDEHNRIPTTDGRLIRRIVRDARTRGTSAAETIRRWESVRRGEEKYIFPFQEEADIMFNSALVYELACLKVYAEPLLFGIDRNLPEFTEANRLLKFLDYFVPVPGTDVPNNSILREFIGGSIFRV